MQRQLTRRERSFLVIAGLFLLAALFAHVSVSGQRRFFLGRREGIYWFYLGYTQYLFPIICLALAVLLIVVLRRPRDGAESDANRIATSAVSLVLVLVLLCVGPAAWLLNRPRHMERFTTADHVYYLARKPDLLLGTDYVLFQCDSRGLVCNNYVRTGYVKSDHASIFVDPETTRIAIKTEDGTLHGLGWRQ